MDLADDQLSFALFSDDEDYDSRPNSRSGTYGGTKPYSKNNGGAELTEMRKEVVHLEGDLSRVLHEFSSTSKDPKKRSLQLARYGPFQIEKYVELMELTKCLRRQKEFLLQENRKRQRFAEKIQAAMPPSTDSITFMKSVKFGSDGDLNQKLKQAFDEMQEYDVNGNPENYFGWQTKRDTQSMYLHMYSEKTFPPQIDFIQVYQETWKMFFDEELQKKLHKRRTKFCIIKKMDDSTYLTRNIHQLVGESFPRHALTLVRSIALDANTLCILSKSVPPQGSDAQHLVWTDEVYMWKFVKRPEGGFDLSIRGKYGSSSAVAGNRIAKLESYFLLIDWESTLINPIFDFQT